MARLVRGVWVGGQHYGADRQPDDDVARQITNPAAWEGGEVPFPVEEPAGDSSGPDTAPAPSEAATGDEKPVSRSTKKAPAKRTAARKKG
jgi:hypothetical protein